MVCPDCGAGLDAVATHEPCPRCGRYGRDAHVVVGAIHVGVVVSAPVVEVEPNLHRPWCQKWSNTLTALESLEEAYRRVPKGGNLEVDARVQRFFGECNDLPDWLKSDKVSLPNLPDRDVNDHATGDHNLRVCNGIANTHKHHTPTRGKDPVTARICRTRTTDSGASVTIEHSSPSDPNPRHVDARDLSRACVASWRAFFKGHGIVEP